MRRLDDLTEQKEELAGCYSIVFAVVYGLIVSAAILVGLVMYGYAWRLGAWVSGWLP